MSTNPPPDFGLSDLSRQRAYVIERSINIEWIINAIISQHYFGRVVQQFVHEVLYDEQFSFGLRRRILEKVSKWTPTLMNKLGRLNTIRNLFAHCNQVHLDANMAGAMVPNPRKPTEALDFEGMFAEFGVLANELERALADEYVRCGGIFVPARDAP